MSADATKKADDDQGPDDDPGERLLADDASHPAAVTINAGLSWPTVLGCTILTINLCVAVYRSEGDPAAVGFVAFSYLDLVLLFYCVRRFENAEPDSPARRHLKLAVWVLTTLLTAVFSYKIAAVVPLPLQILVWVLAASTVGGGFFVFFLYQQGKVSARFPCIPTFSFSLCGASLNRLCSTNTASHFFYDFIESYKFRISFGSAKWAPRRTTTRPCVGPSSIQPLSLASYSPCRSDHTIFPTSQLVK
jgi:hypothetical protein